MARSAYLPLAADRYEPCVRTIVFRGFDLRNAPMRAQVRLVEDTPGAPLVDLQTVTNGNAEGIRLTDYQVIDGIPVSTIELVINETTMEGLPYIGELGSPSPMAYDLQATIAGRKRKLFGGPFVVLPGVTGADDAPTERSQGWGVAQRPQTWTTATLHFSDDKAEISLAGLDLFDQVAAVLIASGEEQRATAAARALRYGISDAAAARLFTGSSTEAAFAERVYRNAYRVSTASADLPGWTYARTGAAMAPTSGGLLQPFASGTPRVTDAGLRIEAASANTARPGNDFSNALWTKTGVALSGGAAGPMGSMTRVTATSAGYHFVGQVMDSVGTVSVYARGGGIRRVGIQIETGAGTKKVVFDLLTGGVISADSEVTAWMDPGPLGTYRLVATVANSGAATVRIHALADDGSDAFAADGSKSFEMSAVQTEPGAIVTSYIDTVDVPAERALDTASLAFAPFGDFTIFAEAGLRRSEGLENTIVSLIGTSPANRVALLRDTSGRLAVEVVNEGVSTRVTGPIKGEGTVRIAVTVRGSQVAAAIDGETVLTLAATRPANLQTLWLGIRGTVEAALNGTLRRVLTVPFALTQDELIDMTGIPRSLTASDGTDTEAVRQMIITHSNDQAAHGLTESRRAIAEADSKTGIWSVAATAAFAGADGTALGNTDTGGYTWTNNSGIQRIGGRAKQPSNAFAGAWITTAFADGQVEADLYPDTGEASLFFRINNSENQFFLLQRGGDGTVRLAHVFTETALIAPMISLPVVAGERWKVRCFGSTILTYRIVDGAEELIHHVTDTRLTTATKFGFRLNGTGSVDNFRLLKREAL